MDLHLHRRSYRKTRNEIVIGVLWRLRREQGDVILRTIHRRYGPNVAPSNRRGWGALIGHVVDFVDKAALKVHAWIEADDDGEECECEDVEMDVELRRWTFTRKLARLPSRVWFLSFFLSPLNSFSFIPLEIRSPSILDPRLVAWRPSTLYSHIHLGSILASALACFDSWFPNGISWTTCCRGALSTIYICCDRNRELGRL